MKIALVAETFDLEGGGAERSAAQTATALAARGHDVTFLAAKAVDADASEDRGYSVTAWPAGSRAIKSFVGPFRFRQWATGLIDENDFDASLSITMAVPAAIVQPRGGTIRETLHRNIQLRSSLPARWLKQLTVATSPRQRAMLHLEKSTLQDPRVKHIVALSDYVRRQLQDHYAVADERITIIPNAASLPERTPEERETDRQHLRAGLNIPEDAVVFVFAAVNPRLKGIDTLIPAFAKTINAHQATANGTTSDQSPPVLMLAGSVDHSHAEAARQHGIREHIRLVGATRQMATAYAAADVTVLPSHYDPSSKVVIESLMSGTPAISTSFNGASDFITATNPPRGRVIENPSDVDALAAAMIELCDDKARALATKACGPELASELSMDRHVQRLEDLLKNVAAG